MRTNIKMIVFLLACQVPDVSNSIPGTVFSLIAHSSEERSNKASKNINARSTTEERVDTSILDVCDTENQATDGKTPEIIGFQRSGSKSDKSSSSSSSSNSSSSSSDSRNKSESEVFDDSDADEDWNPSSDEESSEDELQKNIDHRVLMTQTLSSSNTCKVGVAVTVRCHAFSTIIQQCEPNS
ncbi:uncharacterized protein isoform X2 [Leptinotarsa decemlineata]|uniref:uncharacterized protein isoform X2 n=1 Tax=Leptinotarsa decemlineata TaxID=7539 RepID=UPI003D307DC4